MANDRPNWEELKTEYITGTMGYRQMCEEHGVSMTALKTKAKNDKWVEARSQYRQEVATRTVSAAMDAKVNHLTAIAVSADKMADIMQKAIEDQDQFFRRVSATGEESIGKKIDSKAIREMTAAMKDLTAVIRNVYNIPTESENLSMQLARERLEIERRKADTADDLVYGLNAGVVLIPPVDDEEVDEDEE